MTTQPSPSSCVARNRPFLSACDADKKVILFFRANCRNWSCPHCARQNAIFWAMSAQKSLIYYAAIGIDIRFCTITSHEKLKTTAATVKVFKSAWPMLLKRMRREYGDDLGYFGVPEQHKDGRLHFHFFSTHALTNKWLKGNARECGLGYHAKSIKVEGDGKGAWYVSKYLHKSFEVEWPKKFRRIRKSQNWWMMAKSEYEGNFQFNLLNEPIEIAWKEHVASGFTAMMVDADLAWKFVQIVDDYQQFE